MPPKVTKVESEDHGPSNGTPLPAQSPPAAAPSPINVPSRTATPTSTNANTPAGTPAPRPPPTTRPSTSNTRGRGTTSRPRVAAPKFAGRRSAAARAEAEKAEAERKRVESEGRLKAEAAKARRDGRGRGGFAAGGERYRGRGRGGYMGDREPGRGGGDGYGVGAGNTGGKGSVMGGGGDVMSGPFGGGRVVQDIRRAGAASSSGGGGGGGSSSYAVGGGGSGARGASSGGRGGRGGGGGGSSGQVKQEPGTSGGDFTMMTQGGPVKTEDGGYVSSDEDEDPKTNVDQLGVIDLTLGEDDHNGFQPVRIKREEHKTRTLGLNADGATAETIVSNDAPSATTSAAATAAKTVKHKGKDVEITGASDPFHGTYSSSDEQDPPIKVETTDDGPQHVLAPLQDAPSSPETRRKGKERTKVRTLSGSHAPARPVYQTKDELEEWERGQEELRVLYEELGTQTAATHGVGDAMAVDGAAAEVETQDKKADKVYLFQFPPVLPDLTAISVKPDPDAPTANSEGAPTEENGEAMDVDLAPPASNGNATASSSKPAAATGRADLGEPGTRPPLLPSGAVGKLRIHRSGKATMDWGGTKLSLGMGTTAGFLQDVMISSLPDRKPTDGLESDGDADRGKEKGWAVGMGQVKGKFVVVPDWSDVLG